MKARPRPVVGISLGDPSGVGPEVLAEALKSPQVCRALTPLVFGDASVPDRFPSLRSFERVSGAPRSRIGRPTFSAISALLPSHLRPGKPSHAGARASLAYVEALVMAARMGQVDALCTGPVSKEALSRVGAPFVGHTEFLARAFRTRTLMVMVGPKLTVALATNHLPLADVPAALDVTGLASKLVLLSSGLKPLLERPPRIAVLALNPHAGDGGLLGKEEESVIAPAIRKARARGVDCAGPFAADGYFAGQSHPFDAALAMYHDQGLIPVKAVDFEHTVNLTLGLPLPRTSPDHGVAYGLAGTGKASAQPTVSALLLAARLAGK